MRDKNAASDPRRGGVGPRSGGPVRASDRQPAYERWTKERLYGRAREVGIRGRSQMSKGELIAALRER